MLVNKQINNQLNRKISWKEIRFIKGLVILIIYFRSKYEEKNVFDGEMKNSTQRQKILIKITWQFYKQFNFLKLKKNKLFGVVLEQLLPYVDC